MIDTIETLREGDVYRWGYRDPNTKHGAWGDYHCCSRIAIVSRGRLRDTYWQIGTSFNECRSFGLEDLPKLELTFIANLADLEPAKEYQADYYDDADIVNLNHSNHPSGNFYLRKGAKRSQDKMLAVARQRLAEAEADERTAVRRRTEISQIIDQIEAGTMDGYIPSWRRA